MKKIIVLLVLIVLGYSIQAQAGMMTIGTATYGGSDYNLIWDDDNNGNSVVWLDYTNSPLKWEDQKDWAAGLDSFLSYNIHPGYLVSWADAEWRLPTTVDGGYDWGWDGTSVHGYNITTSEMGHLFYTELGNKGWYALDGTVPQSGWGLTETGDFQQLSANAYWSSTENLLDPDPDTIAWIFDFRYGDTEIAKAGPNRGDSWYGLAIRSGVVVYEAPIPEPTTIAMLGIGIVGLAGAEVRRRRKKKSINS